MNYIEQWLSGLGLEHIVPTLKAHGINNPKKLAQLTVKEIYDIGVDSIEDRKKLYYLIQRLQAILNKEQKKGADEDDASKPEPPADIPSEHVPSREVPPSIPVQRRVNDTKPQPTKLVPADSSSYVPQSAGFVKGAGLVRAPSPIELKQSVSTVMTGKDLRGSAEVAPITQRGREFIHGRHDRKSESPPASPPPGPPSVRASYQSRERDSDDDTEDDDVQMDRRHSGQQIHRGSPDDFEELEGEEYTSDSDESGPHVIDMPIRVVVRKRPLSKNELNRGEKDVMEVLEGGTVLIHEPKIKVDLTKIVESSEFVFDDAFDDSETNESIYRRTVKPLVHSIFEGGKATCFAYGQTGSGKTHTMMGSNPSCPMESSPNTGLYVLAAKDLFGILQQRTESLQLYVSCFEIYGGKLFDLLNDRSQIRCLEDARQQVQLPGLSEHPVQSVEQLLQKMSAAHTLRSTGATGANETSSRSHQILQLSLKKSQEVSRNMSGRSRRALAPEVVVLEHGKLSFIDLAGSERGADTGNSSKQTRMEGADINTSLLALKEVIRSMERNKGKGHTPFRGSKLTQVLKDSFVGPNTHTCMVACVSPSSLNCEHTLNTLRYADRVKEHHSNIQPQALAQGPTQAENIPVQVTNAPSVSARPNTASSAADGISKSAATKASSIAASARPTSGAGARPLSAPIDVDQSTERRLSGGGGGSNGAAAKSLNRRESVDRPTVATTSASAQTAATANAAAVSAPKSRRDEIPPKQSAADAQAARAQPAAQASAGPLLQKKATAGAAPPTSPIRLLSAQRSMAINSNSSSSGIGVTSPSRSASVIESKRDDRRAMNAERATAASASASSTAPEPKKSRSSDEHKSARDGRRRGEEWSPQSAAAAADQADHAASTHIINAHKQSIAQMVDVMKTEMELVQEMENADDRDAERYVDDLEVLLQAKYAAISKLRDAIRDFQSYRKQRQ